MDNHTQYLGFAGVDLAKKVMQIHFVTADTVEWHPVFKNIVESICFNKKEKRHDKGTM